MPFSSLRDTRIISFGKPILVNTETRYSEVANDKLCHLEEITPFSVVPSDILGSQSISETGCCRLLMLHPIEIYTASLEEKEKDRGRFD